MVRNVFERTKNIGFGTKEVQSAYG